MTETLIKPELETFLNRLKFSPISVTIDVDGRDCLFETIPELVSKDDGGVFEDEIIDVWATCIYDGEIIAHAIISIEIDTMEVWEYRVAEKTDQFNKLPEGYRTSA